TVCLISRSIAFLRDRSGNRPRRKLDASPKDRPPVLLRFPKRTHSFCLWPTRVRAALGWAPCQQYLRVGGVVMRIALAIGLCLIAFASTAAPRAKTDKPQPPQIETPVPSVQSTHLRENYRSRLNENVVTIMAASPSETDLTIASEIAQVVDDGDNLRVLPIVGRGV